MLDLHHRAALRCLVAEREARLEAETKRAAEAKLRAYQAELALRLDDAEILAGETGNHIQSSVFLQCLAKYGSLRGALVSPHPTPTGIT